MFDDFWKKCMSMPCFRLSMVCPLCNNLEWRLGKRVNDFEVYGCARCRLLLGHKLSSEPDLKKVVVKKLHNYRVSGRYE